MIKERLISLDVFRGFTILFMIIVNNPGNWSAIYQPLAHAEWNGCTPADLVFPFFIFIMGVAIPLAMPAKTCDSTTFNKIIIRSLRIFCLGLFLNFFSKIELFGLEGIPLLFGRLAITVAVSYALLGNFSLKVKTYLTLSVFVILLILAYSGIEAYQEVRIPGVLQRIGIVYFFVSLLYLKTTLKGQILTASLLLLVYWAVMALVPIPGIGAANFNMNTNLAAWLDNALLPGHLWVYTKTWDPEGILSTVPAIATGISGLLIGQFINRPLPKLEIIKKMIIVGIAIIVLGLLWNVFFPINKSLWTSSYVLYTSGLAILNFALLYYIIDVANYKKGFTLFLIWGINPMVVFFFSGIIPKVLRSIEFKNPVTADKQINLQEYFYSSCIVPFFNNPKSASFTFALVNVMVWSFILWFFYRKKLIFKV
jgi:predicted acyltransferase